MYFNIGRSETTLLILANKSGTVIPSVGYCSAVPSAELQLLSERSHPWLFDPRRRMNSGNRSRQVPGVVRKNP